MNKLSTGDDSTLGNWRKLVSAALGGNSPAVKFLDKKIADSPHGDQEEVIADERQFLYVLFNMGGE